MSAQTSPTAQSLTGLQCLLVPAKAFSQAKSRLGHLALHERRLLAKAMLQDVLTAATAARGIDRVFVLTDDRALARELPPAVMADVTVLIESKLERRYRGTGTTEATSAESAPDAREVGLNRALHTAARWFEEQGATSLMILPGDLPLVTTIDIDRCLEQLAPAGEGPAVVIAPDEAGEGTNALILCPPTVINPGYGAASAKTHAQRATQAGARLTVWSDADLGFDIDTSTQLLRLRDLQLDPDQHIGTHTSRALESLGDRKDQASQSGSLLMSAIAQATGSTQA